jgi:RimJ/RimL family protein N-acetyltransferase
VIEDTDDSIVVTLFQEDDATVLCTADADPQHRRRFDVPDDFVGSIRHSKDVLARWQSERLEGRRFPYAVCNAATGELLGGVELRPLGNGMGNFSYWTYPPHRRQRVASRALALACEMAFAEFGFRILRLGVDPDKCRVASSRALDRYFGQPRRMRAP